MRKPFGKTIRQEVVNHAVIKLCIWRRQGQAAKTSDAIEAVIDGARQGTLGGMMQDYVLGIGELAYARLEKEIERKAK